MQTQFFFPHTVLFFYTGKGNSAFHGAQSRRYQKWFFYAFATTFFFRGPQTVQLKHALQARSNPTT